MRDAVSTAHARQVMVINKWDTVPDKDGTTMTQYEKVSSAKGEGEKRWMVLQQLLVTALAGC